MQWETLTCRTKIATVAVVLVVLTIATTVVLAQGFDLPGFVSAKEEIPVEKPKSGQQVAVLQIDLRSGNDGSVSAELTSQRVIDSFAPKSASRSGGDWEVSVVGERALKYLVPNPLHAEIENPDDRNDPFDRIQLDSYEWTLIVPLYDQSGSLGAETIAITDLATGATILRTAVRSD